MYFSYPHVHLPRLTPYTPPLPRPSLNAVLSERPVLGHLLQHMLDVHKAGGSWTKATSLTPSPSSFTLDALNQQEEDLQTVRQTSPNAT